MEKYKILKSFRRIYAALSSINIDYLLRKDVLGNNSLQDHKPIIEDLVSRCAIILENSENISGETLGLISDFFFNITEVFDGYNRLSDADFLLQKEVIESVIFTFKDELDNLWEKVAGVIKLKNVDLDIQQKINDIHNSKDEIGVYSSEIKKTLNEIENLKRSVSAQLDEWKERYNDDNVKVELVTQGKSFANQSAKNEKNSRLWIIGVLISTVILISLLFCFLDTIINEIIYLKSKSYLDYNKLCKTCSENVLWLYFAKSIAIKSLLISINIYLIRFCVKNYNACKHNQTINEQKQSSFDVAFHFYNTIVSDRKEEILIMAANSIFSHQQTGYIGKDSEPSNPAILEKIIGKAEDLTKK